MKTKARRPRASVGATFIAFFRSLGAWLACGLVAAVGALVFFAWLSREVLRGEALSFDAAGRSLVQEHGSPPLTSLMRFVTTLGSTELLVAFGLSAGAAFLTARWRRSLVLFSVTMAGAAILNATLKWSFGRARPATFFDTPVPASYSFPSGHALFSFCFYGALAAAVAPHLRRTGRGALWAAAALLVSLIGFSRVYLGVHYPTDVLAGYAAALVWMMVVASADYTFRRRRAGRLSGGTAGRPEGTEQSDRPR